MKKVFLLLCAGIASLSYAQVGVNNDTPNATLDVTAKTTDGTTVEGVLIPRISRTKAATMSNPVSSTEVSTLIYVNDVTEPSSDAAETTSAVTEVGFYFFDGAKWNRISYEKPGEGTTKVKQLEYAVNAVPIDANTITDSETCLGDLCVRLNTTNPSAGEEFVQYKIDEDGDSGLSSEALNIWGEKAGGNGGFYETQHQGLVTKTAGTWANFESKPNISRSDMTRYTVSFTYSKQIYRLNVAVNPTSGSNEAGVSIYLERMAY